MGAVVEACAVVERDELAGRMPAVPGPVTVSEREQQLLENVVAAATELVTWIVSQENETAQSFHFKALEGALKALSEFRQDDVTPSN